MKAAVLVNGVPASGKSTVARAMADAGHWPLLTLDTIKEALFHHLGTGDREYSRLLGRASYETIFALAADFPEGFTIVADCWFGFQPVEILVGYLERAKIARFVELWCHAPPEVIAARYLARVGERSAGHLGETYVPELRQLAASARPIGRFPMLEVDTTAPFDAARTMAWIRKELAR
jgi:predicted kinase